ncbi:putative reverse transcriptase domain-containing protein [Tanacetum coccineum]
MNMTIHSSIKAKILEAQSEAFKEINTPEEMLRGLDKQFERKEDGGLYFVERIWVPAYGNLRNLIMKPMLQSIMYILEQTRYREACKIVHQQDHSKARWPVSIISDRDSHFTSRFWQSLQKALGMQLDLSTAYHPQTDGQSERTIQTLEDMFRACAIDFGGNWDTHLPLVEFSYNNSYHTSMKCALFEALYGRKCRTPIAWAEVGESQLIRPEIVQETTDKIEGCTRSSKSYADNRRKPLEFSVGPFEVVERVGPVAYRLRLPQELVGMHDTFHVSTLKKCLADVNLHVSLEEIKIDDKLCFVEEPIEIMDREVTFLKWKLSVIAFEPVQDIYFLPTKVGTVADRLELPQQLSRVHSTFHVSNLKKCLSDEPLAIPLDEIHIDDKLYFVEEPVKIMDHEVKRLKQSRIPIVKVRWNSRRGPEFTWEHKDQFRKKYLHLFTKTAPSTSAAGEWFKKDCIGSVTTWEDLVEKFVQKFYQLSDDNEEIEAEEDDDPDDITDIFKIEVNLCDYKTPLTYKEYELNNTMTRDLKGPWSDNGVPYQLCDHICEPYRFKNGITKWPTCSLDIDGFCNGGELPGMAHDPNLEINSIFGKNYDTSIASNTQDNQGYKERMDDLTHEPSVCKIRRFEMMKYSFNADEEYIAIKEYEYLNHSKDNLDAYRELLRIINEGWVVATPDEE